MKGTGASTKPAVWSQRGRRGPAGRGLAAAVTVPESWQVRTATAQARERRSVDDDPDRAGAHDLALLDGQGAVGERQRPADAIDSAARLDPVAGLGGLQVVDGQADRRAVPAVVGVGLDRPTQGEVR